MGWVGVVGGSGVWLGVRSQFGRLCVGVSGAVGAWDPCWYSWRTGSFCCHWAVVVVCGSCGVGVRVLSDQFGGVLRSQGRGCLLRCRGKTV